MAPTSGIAALPELAIMFPTAETSPGLRFRAMRKLFFATAAPVSGRGSSTFRGTYVALGILRLAPASAPPEVGAGVVTGDGVGAGGCFGAGDGGTGGGPGTGS